jgi:hypothetical protein
MRLIKKKMNKKKTELTCPKNVTQKVAERSAELHTKGGWGGRVKGDRK